MADYLSFICFKWLNVVFHYDQKCNSDCKTAEFKLLSALGWIRPGSKSLYACLRESSQVVTNSTTNDWHTRTHTHTETGELSCGHNINRLPVEFCLLSGIFMASDCCLYPYGISYV